MKRLPLLVSCALGLAAGAEAQIGAANGDCGTAFPASDGLYGYTTVGGGVSGLLATGLPPYIAGMPDTACEDFNGMPEALNVDVFIDFTPDTNDDYVILTCNIVSYDSKLAIYSGPCGSEVALACNDDATSCSGFSSRLLVSGLSSGTSYKVQLGGYGPSDTGGGQVDLSPAAPPPPVPPNDDCANATDIGFGDQLLVPFDNTGATTDGADHFLCDWYGSSEIDSDLWYRWTATQNGNALFSTCTSLALLDTKIAVYDATAGCGSPPIDCQDDNAACPGTTEEILFPVLAGNSYLLRIGSWQAGQPPVIGEFNVTESDPVNVGTNYCVNAPNSVTPMGETTGAIITGTGSVSVTANDLLLHAGPMRVNEPGIFFFGTARLNMGNGLPFGDGFRCAGGTVVRMLPPTFSDSNGVLHRIVNNTAHPEIVQNVTLHFQAWYRDPGGPGGTSFNLSDGLTVLFAP